MNENDLSKAILTQYFESVKADSKLSFDDKLIKVALPLYIHFKLFHPLSNGTHPFTPEHIDIETELDLNKLKADNSKYVIHPSVIENIGRRGLIEPETDEVYIIDFAGITEESETTIDEFTKIKNPSKTIEELHELWLPSLDADTMKSKDLLTQILVTLTIKKALNGNEDAINKLVSLYEGKARHEARRLANNYNLEEYNKDIEQEAYLWLRFIISGFSQKEILNSLFDNNGSDYFNVPDTVKKFYLEYLTEYVPNQINEALLIGKIRGYKDIAGLMLMGVLNPYFPIDIDTQDQSITSDTRSFTFNKYCFRPTKKVNITTWLFGKYGAFNRGFKDQIIEKHDRLKHKELPHDFEDDKDHFKSKDPSPLQRLLNKEMGKALDEIQRNPKIKAILDKQERKEPLTSLERKTIQRFRDELKKKYFN